MTGHVDDRRRALLGITVRNEPGGESAALTAWIDTGFDGHLVFPRETIQALSLQPLAQAEAILADGNKVVLDTFLCYLDWFGDTIPLQVIANDGSHPLLGTGLLAERVLQIDYQRRTLSLL